ncbi:hypothetical protein JOB18_033981 [Solea senegalensis]|uniref:Uncharacterized protein n=1 Tax=Solea senegalensis TaxID=28829 RepID=A0AAV6R494_SOLSE|nr:hypothetical protein JOB18_033981 [Solea senegalensis]
MTNRAKRKQRPIRRPCVQIQTYLRGTGDSLVRTEVCSVDVRLFGYLDLFGDESGKLTRTWTDMDTTTGKMASASSAPYSDLLKIRCSHTAGGNVQITFVLSLDYVIRFYAYSVKTNLES